MLSSGRAAEVDGVETEEVSVVAEVADVVDQVLRDRLVERNSRVALWVLRFELRL